ncbi:hypothetical protein [Novosphingobium beihaiensis]|uniref:Uncharacterized protein n=1 Tax=Novosphingobium beihaiensis TaxID=2930389 RepID=A0ABT0BN59_9SPHN|nr:hypothetical protein [Novosphingobium beihaiensis]MCJ2186487.1 hypothetical protein [Novosphingobium beihaiensis]
MTMMLSPDLLDRRALALIALRDAFGRPVRSPVHVTGEGVRALIKKDGTIAVLDAPGFGGHIGAFSEPPANPAIGSKPIPIAIEPSDPALQARHYVLALPRDPDPANRAQPNSLFRAAQVSLLATPQQKREGLACVLRVCVHRKGDGAAIGGALVRARSDNGKFEAMGVTDKAGEAALVFPDLPVAFPGAGGNMDPALPAKAIVKVVQASAVFTPKDSLRTPGGAVARKAGPFDPDKLASGPAPDFAGGTPFLLSAGTEPAIELEWLQP